MGYSDIQKHLLNQELTEWSIKISMITKGVDLGVGRLTELRTQEFFIEHLIVNAQMVEQLIKVVLAGYATRRRILTTLGEADSYKDVKLDYENRPLGEVITILSQFTGKTTLIEKLWRLNNERKEVVHHLFYGDKNLDKVNGKSADFTREYLPSIIKELWGEMHKMNTKIEELADLAGVVPAQPKTDEKE